MMQTIAKDSAPAGPVTEGADFRRVLYRLNYEDLQDVRRQLSEFLGEWDIPGDAIGNILLAVSEILSNLVRHPRQKASHVEVRVRRRDKDLDIDIADNSTPFANFDAKCKIARRGVPQAAAGAECGYGLSCILSLYPGLQYAPADKNPDGFNRMRFSHALDEKRSPVKKAGKKLVFLVDDDPISLMIHEVMLKDHYDVVSFSDARKALAAFPARRPEMIISDLRMPDMDGADLRLALSQAEGGDLTPFIFLSGHAEKEHSHYISALGVDDFLSKPVTRERLLAVVARLLHRSQQIRSSVQGQFSQDIAELLAPVLPQAYGRWSFATRHRAVDTGGGDFILHHAAENGMIGALADVMGHGPRAKFFSYAYAGYLHSMFRMKAGDFDPAQFLQYLSREIEGDPLLENMIMTCQCFQFTASGILKAASAGHPPPILFRGGVAGMFDVAGPLPGLVGDSVYELKSVQLMPGDAAIFMTDGFLEVFDRRGSAALRVLDIIQGEDDKPPKEFMDILWRHYTDRAKNQASHHDDATLIMAIYGGEA